MFYPMSIPSFFLVNKASVVFRGPLSSSQAWTSEASDPTPSLGMDLNGLSQSQSLMPLANDWFRREDVTQFWPQRQ